MLSGAHWKENTVYLRCGPPLQQHQKPPKKLAHVALMFEKFGKCSKHGNPLCLRISGSAHSGGTISWIQNCIFSVPILYTFLQLLELIEARTLRWRVQKWARWNRRESWNHQRSHLPANLLQLAQEISRDGFSRPQGASENILILNIYIRKPAGKYFNVNINKETLSIA